MVFFYSVFYFCSELNLGTENLEVWKTPGYSLDFELGLTYARGPIPQLFFFLKKKEKQNKNPKCFLNVLTTLFHHPNDFYVFLHHCSKSNFEFRVFFNSEVFVELRTWVVVCGLNIACKAPPLTKKGSRC